MWPFVHRLIAGQYTQLLLLDSLHWFYWFPLKIHQHRRECYYLQKLNKTSSNSFQRSQHTSPTSFLGKKFHAQVLSNSPCFLVAHNNSGCPQMAT